MNMPSSPRRIGEIFLSQTTRMRSNRGKRLAFTSVTPPKDETLDNPLYHLASAVLSQACVDAKQPDFMRTRTNGVQRRFHIPHDQYQRIAMWDALLFLTDPTDEWLPFWCSMLNLEPAAIRSHFLPLRMRFQAEVGWCYGPGLTARADEIRPRLMEPCA